ncbi:MAG: orotate phosphoribosyltransferase [Campylobacter sp.]|nr:orotate phosphoribosyltransferase [Campylobacter sp.]
MKENLAKALFDTKAVFLSPNKPFTWASGIKSPVYCDNRVLISYPKERKIVASELANLIKERFPQVELIGATATGAIAHGAFVSEILGLPMVYILSKSKDHGRGKMIEGAFKNSQKVVILEDLISTGGSAIASIQTAKNHGLEVLGCVSIFNYGFDEAVKAFDEVGVKFYSLLSFLELIDYAKKQDLLNENETKMLEEWRANPASYYA